MAAWWRWLWWWWSWLLVVEGQRHQVSRVVSTKQGMVRGILAPHGHHPRLRAVEAFLGLPYASPPVGQFRFMPPMTPLRWDQLRLADRLGPACPQRFPRSVDPDVTPPRRPFLKKLEPFLRDQREDCLYLNVYAPAQAGRDRDAQLNPVLVFIHGESFEWNSGNPYDGSVLAAYSSVVVVTVNYRLGVLGFLRPGLSEDTRSNFGLFDQVAALHWVQNNIATFGGDPGNVTLVGHGTGAACVNFLLLSPVAQAINGLFRRAILMSGSALSPLALTSSPLQFTIQLAEALNCPVGPSTASCLQKKRLSELLEARSQVRVPNFRTPFGPVVDGAMVPNEPVHIMTSYRDLFRRYDLLYGVTQAEGASFLEADALAHGVSEQQRDKILREFAHNHYEKGADTAAASILHMYYRWGRRELSASATRDALMAALGDAMVVAPVLKMAELHSQVRPASFLYVFSHRSESSRYPEELGSIPGEELAYVFGAPLVGGTLGPWKTEYTARDRVVSEMVMRLFTNFARTGNPNYPSRGGFLTSEAIDYPQLDDIVWPAFSTEQPKYLDIALPLVVRSNYRREFATFWNENLPAKLAAQLEVLPPPPPPPLTPEEPKRRSFPPARYPATPYPPILPPPAPAPPIHFAPPVRPKPDLASDHPENQKPSSNPSPSEPPPDLQATMASATLRIALVTGVCLLLLNGCACAGMFYQRRRLRLQEEALRKKFRPLKPGESLPSHVGDIVDITNKRRGRGRKDSVSTEDAQSKVRNWIARQTPPATTKAMALVRKATVAVDATGGPEAADPVRIDAVKEELRSTLPRPGTAMRQKLHVDGATTTTTITTPSTTPTTAHPPPPPPLPPGDPLEAIRRLQLPKVLPDLPPSVVAYQPETVRVLKSTPPPARSPLRLQTFRPDPDEPKTDRELGTRSLPRHPKAPKVEAHTQTLPRLKPAPPPRTTTSVQTSNLTLTLGPNGPQPSADAVRRRSQPTARAWYPQYSRSLASKSSDS